MPFDNYDNETDIIQRETQAEDRSSSRIERARIPSIAVAMELVQPLCSLRDCLRIRINRCNTLANRQIASSVESAEFYDSSQWIRLDCVRTRRSLGRFRPVHILTYRGFRH